METTRMAFKRRMDNKVQCMLNAKSEHPSALKRNELLTHAAAWTNSDNIMLSEGSQTQRTEVTRICLHEAFRDREQNRRHQGWQGEGTGSSGLLGTQFQGRLMKTFWKWIIMMVAQHCELYT